MNECNLECKTCTESGFLLKHTHTHTIYFKWTQFFSYDNFRTKQIPHKKQSIGNYLMDDHFFPLVDKKNLTPTFGPIFNTALQMVFIPAVICELDVYMCNLMVTISNKNSNSETKTKQDKTIFFKYATLASPSRIHSAKIIRLLWRYLFQTEQSFFCFGFFLLIFEKKTPTHFILVIFYCMLHTNRSFWCMCLRLFKKRLIYTNVHSLFDSSINIPIEIH